MGFSRRDFLTRAAFGLAAAAIPAVPAIAATKLLLKGEVRNPETIYFTPYAGNKVALTYGVDVRHYDVDATGKLAGVRVEHFDGIDGPRGCDDGAPFGMEPGEPGLPGEPGPIGVEGPIGPSGPIGCVGHSGPTGDPGIPGPIGLQGPVGSPGCIGVNGAPGTNGLRDQIDRYGVYVENDDAVCINGPLLSTEIGKLSRDRMQGDWITVDGFAPGTAKRAIVNLEGQVLMIPNDWFLHMVRFA